MTAALQKPPDKGRPPKVRRIIGTSIPRTSMLRAWLAEVLTRQRWEGGDYSSIVGLANHMLMLRSPFRFAYCVLPDGHVSWVGLVRWGPPGAQFHEGPEGQSRRE